MDLSPVYLTELSSYVGEALDGLIEYVDTHFAREEQYMDECGYPDLVLHAKKHRKLASTVHSLKTLFPSVVPCSNLPLLAAELRAFILEASALCSATREFPAAAIDAQASHGLTNPPSSET